MAQTMIQQIANRYQILSLIGQGGMADVYRAKDKILDRIVAIKVLRSKLSEDPMILVRFQREASAASRLSHPNVVDIYDVGEFEGLHYIVMEYIRGRTLKQLIQQRGALHYNEAIDIMKQLTSAIAAAHQNHIIHRDIKPQNVLIKDDGTVKITDFGIAVANDSVQLTLNNAVMGSAHYLAPETAQGKEPSYQVDIYSLGIVFYELLTGSVPFTGQTPTEIAIKHLRVRIPYVRDFNPSIPQSVENIVLKATAKDPDQRYQYAQEMLYDLEHCRDLEYRNMQRIDIDDQPISHVEVKQGRVNVEYEEKKPTAKKRKPRKSLWLALGISLAVILSAGTLFVLQANGIISIGSLFGQAIMPDVVNMEQEDALQALEEAGISKSQIKVEEEANDAVKKGYVISSNIKAGESVSDNETVTLSVCKGPTFLVPDYTGQYLSDVEEQLEEEGVNIKIEVEEKSMADTNPGYILEQKGLNVGSRIDPDEEHTITFVVAAYPQVTISQDWIGQSYQSVYRELNAMGIAVVQSGSGSTIVNVSPAIGSIYTQEGSNSYITLYTE